MSFLKKWLFVVGFVSFFWIGCKTSKNDSASLEIVIQDSISKVYTRTYNQDSTYLLATEEQTSEKEFIKFMVVNLQDQKIVLEKKFRPGHVRWFDKTTLELLDAPGMIKADERINDYIQYIKIANQE